MSVFLPFSPTFEEKIAEMIDAIRSDGLTSGPKTKHHGIDTLRHTKVVHFQMTIDKASDIEAIITGKIEILGIEGRCLAKCSTQDRALEVIGQDLGRHPAKDPEIC